MPKYLVSANVHMFVEAECLTSAIARVEENLAEMGYDVDLSAAAEVDAPAPPQPEFACSECGYDSDRIGALGKQCPVIRYAGEPYEAQCEGTMVPVDEDL